MASAPLNWRGESRDRKDAGERDRGGKTTARSQLASERPQGRSPARRRASSSGSRESSSRWKAPWIVDARDLHGALVRSGLGSVDRSPGSRKKENRVTHDESTGASEARLGKLREEENASSSALGPIRLSPLSRRETRCGSVARPKGQLEREAYKSGSKHVSLKVMCMRGATSLRIHEARVLAPEWDDGRSRFRASRVANVEESQDESMPAALAQASAEPAMTRPAAEAWAKRCSVLHAFQIDG